MNHAARRTWAMLLLCVLASAARAENPAQPAPPVKVAAAAPAPGDRPLPINLPTALQLADARPIDVAVASERIRAAAAELQRARVLWLPTVYVGVDYSRHDGQIQDTIGNVVGASRGSFLAGAGPYAVFAVTDAIFQPLAQRQVLRAREAALQTARNDSLAAVAEAYFTVQQARGELAGALDASRRADALVAKTEKLAPKIVLPVEAVRARTEAARRRQAVQAARERWRTASADLTRLLRLDAAAVVEPVEPPEMQVTLLPPDRPVDDLIPVALTNRPELATQQALVQATLERLRAERLRPLVPSVLLRGSSTSVTGTLAGGLFGGGQNGDLSKFSARGDFDVQLLWTFENLGLGNRARIKQSQAENKLAVLELFRTQDRIAAEVVQAVAQAQSAAARVGEAADEVKNAADSVDKNFEGLNQTIQAGNAILLVIRPQEATAAVQALAQAYSDYYAAVADYNRAQFRLYRALGRPAQLVLPGAMPCPAPAAAP